MLSRTTLLAALGTAAVIAGGSTAGTVLVQTSGNTSGLSVAESHRADAAHEHTADESSAPTPTATPSLPPCPADVKNHGEYVSSVAKANHGHGDHGKPEASEFTHGEVVSAAAQSDCGKPEGAEASEAPENESSDDATESGESHDQSGESHGKSGQSHGKSTDHIPSQAPVAP
jgi:hypothetical protein